MMVGAYANLQGALLNLMEALVAAYIGKVNPGGKTRYSINKDKKKSLGKV